jgi:hypothetical protein
LSANSFESGVKETLAYHSALAATSVTGYLDLLRTIGNDRLQWRCRVVVTASVESHA